MFVLSMNIVSWEGLKYNSYSFIFCKFEYFIGCQHYQFITFIGTDTLKLILFSSVIKFSTDNSLVEIYWRYYKWIPLADTANPVYVIQNSNTYWLNYANSIRNWILFTLTKSPPFQIFKSKLRISVVLYTLQFAFYANAYNA